MVGDGSSMEVEKRCDSRKQQCKKDILCSVAVANLHTVGRLSRHGNRTKGVFYLFVINNSQEYVSK